MSKKELKTLARQTLARVTESVPARVAWIDSKRSSFESYIGRYEVLAAMDLAAGSQAKTLLKDAAAAKTWRASVMSGKNEKTIGHWNNAGTIGLILAGDETKDEEGNPLRPNLLGEIPAATIGHLVPLYRILTAAAKTPEGRAAAEDLVRGTWSDLTKDCEDDEFEYEDENGETIIVDVKDAPEIAAVLAAAEAVAPATKGPKAKTDDESDESDESDEDEKDDEDEDETEDSRRESAASLTVVDAASVEAAVLAWNPQARSLTDEYGAEAVQAIGLAVLRFAAEHGTGTMRHVLSGTTIVVPESELVPDEDAPQDEDAPETAV